MAINDVIGQSQQPIEQPMPIDGEMPDDQQAMGGDDVASPEEQESYDKVVLAGIKALSDPKVTPKIMAMIGNDDGGDPAQRLATATSSILGQIDENSGGTIPESVIIPAAGEILEHVAEFAGEAGVISADNNMVNRAAQLLIIDIGKIYGFDEEDFRSLSDGMSEEDVKAIVQEQEGIAGSWDGGQGNPEMPQQPQPQQQPQQQLPGVINRTIGG